MKESDLTSLVQFNTWHISAVSSEYTIVIRFDFGQGWNGGIEMPGG
jgi:hypothetical protein